MGCCFSPVLADAAIAVHGAVHNTFNVQRHVISRRTLRLFRAEAMQQWDAATMAAQPSSVLRSVAAQSSCRDKALSRWLRGRAASKY
jgi:hypothetical protein